MIIFRKSLNDERKMNKCIFIFSERPYFVQRLPLLMQSLTVLRVASEHLPIALVNGRKALGPFETSNFTCAECNLNAKNLLFLLTCIRFGTCKVRSLKPFETGLSNV